MSTVPEAVQRLRTIFTKLPGIELSLTGAAILSGLPPDDCRVVLSALEDARFLTRSRDGLFVQAPCDSAGGEQAESRP